MFFSVDAVAKKLATTRDHILDLIHAGKLEALNIALPGKLRPRWRITQNALDGFVEAHRTRVPEPTPTRRKRKATAKVNYF